MAVGAVAVNTTASTWSMPEVGQQVRLTAQEQQEWAEARSWLQSLLEKCAEDVRREQVRLSQRIENAMQEEAIEHSRLQSLPEKCAEDARFEQARTEPRIQGAMQEEAEERSRELPRADDSLDTAD